VNEKALNLEKKTSNVLWILFRIGVAINIFFFIDSYLKLLED